MKPRTEWKFPFESSDNDMSERKLRTGKWMRTVWKFPIDPSDVIEVDMPEGAHVLTVQTQGDQVCMWALVNPDRPTERRFFRMAGTGHPIDEELGALIWIGTFQLHGGRLVFHLFELTGLDGKERDE